MKVSRLSTQCPIKVPIAQHWSLQNFSFQLRFNFKLKYFWFLTFGYKTHHLKKYVSQLRLVALNTPLTGDLGSIQSVNKRCRLQAQAMGIRDEYRAFLSHHLQDLIDIVQPPYRTSLPIVNLRVRHLSSLICRCDLVRSERCQFFLRFKASKKPVQGHVFFGLSCKCFLYHIREHLKKSVSYSYRVKFCLKTGKASSPITFSLLGSLSTLLTDEM